MSKVIARVCSASYKGIAQNVKAAAKEISSTRSYLSTNAQNGWAYGKRLSTIKGLSPAEEFFTKTRGVIRQTRIRKQDLPALGGLIGTVSPVPGGSVIGYGIGKLIQFLTR